MTDQVFPPPPDFMRVSEMSLSIWDRQNGDQTFAVKILNEGSGCYPALEIEGGKLELDPDQMVALAEWARALCHWVDAQAKPGDK